MEKISVIVPIYSVEKYIRRCVDSILEQTYTNLEIILVDDGSKDDAGAICDEYRTKDERIKVVHQKNKGLSEARTSGLAKATGEFIGFVDADDWCDSRMYQVLYHNMTSVKADISCCKIQTTSDMERSDSVQRIDRITNTFDADEYMNRIYRGEEENYMVNKLYRKAILDKVWIPFPKERFAEDMAILYRILASCKKIVTCDLPLYYYYKNIYGLCATRKETVYQSYLKNLMEMDSFYENFKKPAEFDRYRLFLLLRAYIELCKWNVSMHKTDVKKEQQIYRKFLEAYRRLPLKVLLKDKRKFKIFLVRIHLMKPIIMIAGNRK